MLPLGDHICCHKGVMTDQVVEQDCILVGKGGTK